MEDYRARRLAHNEAMARRMNEALEKLSPGERSSPEWFICECSRLECTDYIIEITPRDYERIHEHARRFIVRRGHEDGDVEAMVGAHGADVGGGRQRGAG